MMNVTKRLSAMLAAMIMVFCTPLFVFAAGQTELRDDAEMFTSEEETQLQAELDAFELLIDVGFQQRFVLNHFVK